MEAVDSLTFEYGGTRADRKPGPSHDSIRIAGNAYLEREFPKLDWIRRARVARAWRTQQSERDSRLFIDASEPGRRSS